MMVEAATWDDWSTSETRVIEEDDKWHVALVPGEVKVVSLEQLDDLFRLSIVDAETKVWQHGMTEWQPLGVIAGIESPTPKQQTRPRPPSPRSAPPPAPRPAPVSSRAAAAGASAYAHPLMPTPFYAAPSATTPIASAPPIASVRPLTVTQPPPARGGGGFGRFLFGIALLAGVSVTSYRNGLVHEAAHAAHRDAAYTRLEAALGGPSFGTLRAVEQSTEVQSQLQAATAEPAATATKNDTVAKATTGNPIAKSAAPGIAESTPVVPIASLPDENKQASAAKALAIRTQPGRAVLPARQSKPAPVAKSPPISQEPKSSVSDRERLDAAIGQSMGRAAKRSNKSTVESKSNEYDPLNPSL